MEGFRNEKWPVLCKKRSKRGKGKSKEHAGARGLNSEKYFDANEERIWGFKIVSVCVCWEGCARGGREAVKELMAADGLAE